MNVMSIDPGMHYMGIATQSGEGEIACRCVVNPIKNSESESYNLFRQSVQFLIAEYHISLVLIEDYAFGISSRAMSVLGEVKGVVKSAAYQMNTDVIMIPIATWRANVKGIPDKKKHPLLYCKYASSLFHGYAIDTTDEADALFMLHLFNRIVTGYVVSATEQKIADQIKSHNERVKQL